MTLLSVALLKLFIILSLWSVSSLTGQRIQHSWQPPSSRTSATNASFSKLNLIRVEALDVEKLNRLISTIDKTWILPQPGARDPVGSNFQYKKTCASIYKARFGACQQVGFGVMCFNYCFEQGQSLQFRCQDISDSAYCRSSSTFDTFLMKHRNDAYKAKSYIHQMISRCYATAICNQQHGILNTSILAENNAYLVTDQEQSSSSSIASNAVRTNPRILMRKPVSQKQRENSQDVRQQWLKIQPTKRPVPIWQRLLPTDGTTTTPKSFPIVAATEENHLAEEKNEENEEADKSSGTMETTTEESNRKETVDEESNPEPREESTEAIIETNLSTEHTEEQQRTRERPWWWYAALRQLERNTEHLTEQ